MSEAHSVASLVIGCALVTLKWVTAGVTAIICVAILLLGILYAVGQVSEYRHLSKCDSEATVQSAGDAILIVRKAAEGWGDLQDIGVKVTTDPDGSFSDSSQFYAGAKQDSWGFTYYRVVFTGRNGMEITFEKIDKCGNYYPDSVLIWNPN